MSHTNLTELEYYQTVYRNKPENRLKAKIRSAEWYKNNKERAKRISSQAHKEWVIWAREHAPKRLMLQHVRNRAWTKGIEFSLTENDFEIPNLCPILGIELKMNIGRPKGNSPSMDRIDNDKGYIPGNVLVISKEANRMKSDLTLDILDKLREYVSNPQKFRPILGS